MKVIIKFTVPTFALGLLLTGCGNSNEDLGIDTADAGGSQDEPKAGPTGGESELKEAAIVDVKTYIADQLAALHAAAVALQDAAPEPDDDGWNASDDKKAVAAMRDAWRDARAAYEKSEGAIAVLFPNYDASTDERYDGFIEEKADDDLFDGKGVIGIHAIERILWADAHPEQVVAFESVLPNYVAAAFPQDKEEAQRFRDELVQRLVDDAAAMVDQFEPLALDAPAAFRGVIGSVEEQVEKVALAATGEDESRYAGHTLGDMRSNLVGGRQVFEAFVPWLEAKKAGKSLAEDILDGFDSVSAFYDGFEGDAIPSVPEGWDPEDPSPDDLDTPYGKLFSRLSYEADGASKGSLAASMLAAAELLGIASLPE